MTLTPGHFIVLGIVLLLALFLIWGMWELGMVLRRKVVAGQLTESRAQTYLGLWGIVTSLTLPSVVAFANRNRWFGFELNALNAVFVIMGLLLIGIVVQVLAYMLFTLSVRRTKPTAEKFVAVPPVLTMPMVSDEVSSETSSPPSSDSESD